MNNSKRLKPNLLDPDIEKKIIRTLKPPKEDYWGPTKNMFQIFWFDYIVPNKYLVLFIIFIILVLIYRYQIIRKNRINPNQSSQQQQIQTPSCSTNSNIKNANDEADLLLYAYNKQKEASIEPQPIKQNMRSNHKSYGYERKKSGFAYPMYPYVKGGSLAPSGKR
jgi:hypothetical protein